MKWMIPVILAVLSGATLCGTPPAYGADNGGISPGEFRRYQSQQALELEWEQSAHAERSVPESVEESRRQRRRLEAERRHQRQLLEQQRRQVQAEHIKLRPMPRPGPSREKTLQRLGRAQKSERLSRKLLR